MSETGGSPRTPRAAVLAALLVLAACSGNASDASSAPGTTNAAASPAAAREGTTVVLSPDTQAASADDTSSTEDPVIEPIGSAETDPSVDPATEDDPPGSGTDTDPAIDPIAAVLDTAPGPPVTEPTIDAADPECVIRATADTSLESAVRGITPPPAAAPDPSALDIVEVWTENGFADTVRTGDLIDVCVGNGLDDVDGGELTVTDDQIAAALSDNVARQQERLNELFADLGTGDIAVDGASGDRTGQRLCGARLALGIPPSMADMLPGTTEQATLFATSSLPSPFVHDADDERWILIDRTCQLLFAGTGSNMVYAFPTSTGEEGFETRLQDRARAIRFNPALENGGWHDSSEFPVEIDNPLNGNMYKPLYFDVGQAIHGATHVPPTPDSKGCARLRVGDQDRLLAWVGLDEAEEETWRREDLTIEVSVQGDFADR